MRLRQLYLCVLLVTLPSCAAHYPMSVGEAVARGESKPGKPIAVLGYVTMDGLYHSLESSSGQRLLHSLESSPAQGLLLVEGDSLRFESAGVATVLHRDDVVSITPGRTNSSAYKAGIGVLVIVGFLGAVLVVAWVSNPIF